jgi:hypothetical protein
MARRDRSGKGAYRRMNTITAEMITQMMITICIAIQKRGMSCTPLRMAGGGPATR